MNSEAEELDQDEPYRELVPKEEFIEAVEEASQEQSDNDHDETD